MIDKSWYKIYILILHNDNRYILLFNVDKIIHITLQMFDANNLKITEKNGIGQKNQEIEIDEKRQEK